VLSPSSAASASKPPRSAYEPLPKPQRSAGALTADTALRLPWTEPIESPAPAPAGPSLLNLKPPGAGIDDVDAALALTPGPAEPRASSAEAKSRSRKASHSDASGPPKTLLQISPSKELPSLPLPHEPRGSTSRQSDAAMRE
jgi:hypothetical protein